MGLEFKMNQYSYSWAIMWQDDMIGFIQRRFDGEFQACIQDRERGFIEDVLDTLDEAKAWAQARQEDRIRKALKDREETESGR